MIKKFSTYRKKALFWLLFWLFISGVFLASENTLANAKNPEGLNFESSNLAIVIINTNGQAITSSSRIIASMGIIHNGDENINYVNDPFNVYDGQIRIEIRGHSSKGFDQKSYRIETQDSSGNNYNVPLLGMSKDNDWVIYGPYSDKSLIRNALVYNLAGEINAYAPHTRFCELILNNSYQGVYLLIEKIKQDNNRVNISKLNPFDITEPGVSGGYMFKKELSSDKGDNVISLNSGLNLSVIEPRPEEIMSEQTKWLKDYLNNFESALYNNGDYTSYIDVPSMVDNFLMVEFFKNVDGFRASTYFYKDRNARIVAGPVWDYNLSLGNADYNYGWTPQRWYHEDENSWSFYWFDELLSRTDFWDQIKTRWAVLRERILEYNHINQIIDNMVSELEEAQVRHFSKWTILGKYTWPNPGYPESGEWGFPSPTTGAPTTWNGEIDYVKEFVNNRLEWMDSQLDYQPNSVFPDLVSKSDILQAYPNPCSSTTRIKYTLSQPGKGLLKIYNINGQVIRTIQVEYQHSGEYINTIDTKNFENGVYIVRLQIEDRVETLKLIIKK